MGFFDKWHLFTLFMSGMAILGLLLIVVSFMAYQKLTEGCTSDKLRTYLRIATGLGSAIFTIGFGYVFCWYKCNCNVGVRSKARVYFFLFLLLVMGIGLLVLIYGIDDELKKPECNVDLGMLPTILKWAGIIDIIVIVLYGAYTAYQKYPDVLGKLGEDAEDVEDAKSESDVSGFSEEEEEVMAVAERKADLEDSRDDLKREIKSLEYQGSKAAKSIDRLRRSGLKGDRQVLRDTRKRLDTIQALLVKRRQELKNKEQQILNISSQLGISEPELKSQAKSQVKSQAKSQVKSQVKSQLPSSESSLGGFGIFGERKEKLPDPRFG